jgi:dihydroflavonol-4-reductase
VRVLVTGATGFTGGHLARTLARRGYQVRGLARHASQARDLEGSDIEPAIGALEDRAALARAVKDIEVVYHIAAVYRQAGIPKATYRAVNATAVGDLIDAAASAGVRRLVHCSTVGVHGDIEHPPANEEAPLRPADIYQVTKAEGERIARDAAAKTELPVTIARPSGIYGPGDRRLLKLFRGVARRRFVVLGSGNIFYHLTYIDDLVEGFRLCGETPAAANRTYILAGAEVTTLNELLGLIAAEADVAPPALKLPVWPFWVAGAACEAICVPLGIDISAKSGLLHQKPRIRHQPRAC